MRSLFYISTNFVMSRSNPQIVESAIQLFIRRGYRGTTLSNVANNAGVSRPTLYAAYGDKCALFVAAIDYLSNQSLKTMQDSWDACETPDEHMQVYFEAIIIPAYDVLQNVNASPDLITGYNDQGRLAVQNALLAQQDALETVFAPYQDAIGQAGLSLTDLVRLIVLSAAGLKFNADSRSGLLAALDSLKITTNTILGMQNAHK